MTYLLVLSVDTPDGDESSKELRQNVTRDFSKGESFEYGEGDGVRRRKMAS